MGHVVEAASSGRSKCRGCGERIPAGELRFGERLPNPFAEGEMTHWFHPECAAFKRPEPLLEFLAEAEASVPDAERLAVEARRGIEHRRLPRVDRAERASSGRARCRYCREPIAKGAWRIGLVFHEEGRFVPAGFVHASCSHAYFGTSDLLARLRRFSPGLGEDDFGQIQAALTTPQSAPPSV